MMPTGDTCQCCLPCVHWAAAAAAAAAALMALCWVAAAMHVIWQFNCTASTACWHCHLQRN
jgi:hypothetical protein